MSFNQLTRFRLCRRDKYQRKIREYWIETGTEGTYEKEDEEQLKEGWSAEGECGDEFQMGGLGQGPLGAESDDDEDSESEEEDKKSRPKAGKKSNPGKKNDLEEEAALEVGRVTLLCEVSCLTDFVVGFNACTNHCCILWKHRYCSCSEKTCKT